MKICLWGILIVLLSAPAFASSTALEQRLGQISPAVGALYAQTQNGNLEFLCTVTAIEKDAKSTTLLTANHCVRKDVAYVVTFDGKMFHAARVWKVPPESIDPNRYRRQYGQPETDLALFTVDSALTVPVIPIGRDDLMEPGRSIVTVGYPLGVTKIRYIGIVAGRYERPGADIDGYIILQIFGAPGSSGSAVIEEATGYIIGVLVSGRQAFGTPVIFSVPISHLKYLLEVPGRGK
jgi:S1-C subfamily serine protease